MSVPEYLSKGEPARLIPVVADSGREQRAISILMAAMTAVYEFRQAMLTSLGLRVGNRSRLSAWTEVCFKGDKEPKGKNDRPDGLMILETGKSQWRALVEAKIGNAELSEEQIRAYMAQAKQYGVDAVLTVSNQYVALPSHHPVKVPKNLARGVELFHWSWSYAMTQATLLLEGSAIQSEDQRHLLSEILRFFSHDSSGVNRFDRMNHEWKELINRIQAGAILRPNEEAVENTVSSWHQEQRDLCLLMSRKLTRPISLKLSRTHRTDAVQRLRDDCELLVKDHVMNAVLDVPDVVSDIVVSSNLARRTITCSVRIDAPLDKKRSSARVNWLIRQLSKTEPTGIYVKAIRPGRTLDSQATLSDLLENPDTLEAVGSSVPPVEFEVFYLVDLATRFSGNKIFIEEVEKAVPHFYEQVAQRLRPWVASPPTIRRDDPAAVIDGVEKSSLQELKVPPVQESAGEEKQSEPVETGSGDPVNESLER